MQLNEKVKVWDIAVRIFHWTLVVLFFTSYLSGEEEDMLHIYAGYGVLGAVAFRIVWGFIGTKHARFIDFIYGPKKMIEYALSLIKAKPVHYIGHNPLGGAMIILLLFFITLVCWSGLKVYGIEGHGPLANQGIFISSAHANGDEGHETAEEELWEEIHEILANFTLALVFIHIIGAIVSSVIHRENLIKAMITGYKYMS